MARSTKAQASQEAAAETPPRGGYVLLPRQLRKDCQQVGINTLKLVLLIADATLGWDFSRWTALTYATIVAEAGIPSDAGVRRAIAEARAASLIEVQTTPTGTLYAIHRRYWLLARVQPKWHLYKRVPYDPAVDPLDGSSPAITMIAQPVGDAIPDNGSAITMLAQPLKTAVSPSADAITTIAQPLSETPADTGAAITMIATDYHLDSTLLSPGEQAAITMIAQPLSGASPHLASHDAKEIYKEEQEEIKERRSEPVDDADVDSFAQRYADQQVLQRLLAERQALQTLQPGQSGWGAAQRRLRAIAQENTCLQALAVPSATGAEGSDEKAMQDLDALQQRQVTKQALLKLLAEQEQLAALLPSQRGWGAAQGRLRSIAREMAYLQAQATPLAPAASPAEPEAAGAADPAEARSAPALPRPQPGDDPPEPGQDTRWQRLTKLQGELAHLKRTPSMQLMARQRIPRLEAEIKEVLAQLQNSA